MQTARISCNTCHRISVLDNIPFSACPYCSSSNIKTESLNIHTPTNISLIGFDKLNEEQQTIVLSTEGVNYVNAGPGTAKTTTLIARSLYIIHQRRDNIHHPLILTFTRQAVNRIRQALSVRKQDQPQIDTLHGFAYKLLFRYREYLPECFHNFRIINEDERRRILMSVFEQLPFFEQNENENLDGLELRIQQEKRTTPYIPFLMEQCERNLNTETLYFLEEQRRYGLFDFDDLIHAAVHLLSKHSNIAEMVQEQYKYVLVDESQDLTDAELNLLDLITLQYRNLFLVGDEDQSIYGWRGASNRINTWLDTLGCTVHRFVLKYNYRSKKPILESARQLIEHNTDRIRKIIKSEHDKGPRVFVKSCQTPQHEAKMIVNSIELQTNPKAVSRPVSYSEFAVLTRNRSSLKAVRTLLQKKHIPVNESSGQSFLQHPSIRLILAILTFLDIPNEITFAGLEDLIIPEEHWEEFYHKKELSGGSVIETLNLWCMDNKPMEGRGSDTLKLLNNLNLLFSQVRCNTISIAVEKIIECLHLESCVELSEFQAMIRKKERQTTRLHNLLNAVNLEVLDGMETVNDSVHLLTLHASKGKEFKQVFICGLSDDLLPAENGNIEEERRLLYVGMTRAKGELILSYPLNRYGHALKPSCFLKEILESKFAIFSGDPKPTKKRYSKRWNT